jgi:hypothetical protein
LKVRKEEKWYKLAFEEAFYCSIINCLLENKISLLSNIKDITEGKLNSDDALFERFDLGMSSKMQSFMSILVSKAAMEVSGLS